jgi:signal transduction histidine kinase
MNLATKIILSIICVLILVMGGLTYLITTWQRSTFGKSTYHYTKVLGETLCDSITTEMELGRSDLVQGTLERIGQGSPQIRTLRIFNQQGQILRSIIPEEVGKRLDPTFLKGHVRDVSSLFEHRKDGEPVMSFIRPFPNKLQCQRCHDPKGNIIGFLVLDVSIKPIEELVSSSQRLILEGMGVTFLTVIGFILLITSRWVRAPLSRVIGAMKRVEEGDLDVSVHLTSQDELGRVAQSFNSMVETLRKNKRDLEILHQRELERTQKMATIGELAEAIAHEIRNPVAGVSASVKIIREGLEKNDPKTKVFDEIYFQTDRIEKIVSNLLQFARKSIPQPSYVDIHEIIKKTFRLFSFQFQDQRINIEQVFQSHLPQIYADPDQIQHVLMNIVLNAIQSMPEGGTIQIKTFFQPEEEMVHLTLSDKGKGISEETLPKIFKPFFSTKAKGAGLGLAIVEKIVHEHGGKLAVSSAVGVGTTVEISLPTKPFSQGKENENIF